MKTRSAPRPFARLARDTAGNTLAMMTAAMVPLVGVVGGAVDMSRLYLVKSRLQQACDAGALAGRKRMGAGAWNQSSNEPLNVANKFFESNFASTAYGTIGRTATFTEASGRVAGAASANVPMTLMKVFRVPSQLVEVTCSAEQRLPNTDVMFVLDVTGSMSNDPQGRTPAGANESRMTTLKFAAKCFYEALARLDISDAACPTTTFGGVVGGAQVRFGFVPYDSGVNVARLITDDPSVATPNQAPASLLSRRWTYQSRVAEYSTPQFTPWVTTSEVEEWSAVGRSGSGGTMTHTKAERTDCAAYGKNLQHGYQFSNTWTPNPAGSPVINANETERVTYFNEVPDADNKTTDWWTGISQNIDGFNRRTCKRRKTTERRELRYVFKQWIYKPVELDLGTLAPGGTIQYLNGTGGSLPTAGTHDPISILSVPGARDLPRATYTWAGCIEERETVNAASYFPRPAGAYDHDIDGLPDAADPIARKWKVALNDGPIYIRGTNNVGGGFDEGNIASNNPTFTMPDEPTTTDRPRPESSCPPPARSMQTWTADAFKNYVNGLSPLEDTFHDIGLLWGARLISPDGMYKKTNAATGTGGNIERHIIFMTDGQTERGPNKVYGPYGHYWFDRRTTPGAASPSPATVRNEIDNRTAGLCAAVRQKNITLWTVVFGDKDVPASGLNQTIIDQMSTCASPGRAYVAKTKDELTTTFTSIAAQIAQLRLTN